MVADFCDGTHYSNHRIFKEKLAALQVCLYYDDVEVCNPLSSRRGKHKLGKCKYNKHGIMDLHNYVCMHNRDVLFYVEQCQAPCHMQADND